MEIIKFNTVKRAISILIMLFFTNPTVINTVIKDANLENENPRSASQSVSTKES